MMQVSFVNGVRRETFELVQPSTSGIMTSSTTTDGRSAHAST